MASSSVGRWFSQNVWVPDENLAKKDDDLKLPHHTGSNWQAARKPRRRTLIRCTVYALVVVCFVFLLRRITYSPEEDIVRPYSQYRYNEPAAKSVPTQLTAPKATTNPPVDTKPANHSPKEAAGGRLSADDSRHYKGMLKFRVLSASLRQLSSARLGMGPNTVMFAASNVQSAATVLSMACQRAASQNDRIFFALFGDGDIELEQLLKVNGIDKSCKILAIGKQPPSHMVQLL